MRLRLLSISFLCILAGCSSVNPYLEKRQVLELAVSGLEAGNYADTVRTLEQLLADTSEESRDYALQRFFAAYLLTQAHQRANTQAPFLQEPADDGAQHFSLNSTGGGMRPSRIGHLMAVTYHSSFGRSWYDQASGSPFEKEGEKLLPRSLEAYGVKQALAYQNLCYLAVHSELNFQDRVEEILFSMEELTDLSHCEALMKAVQLDPAIRPWVYLAVFEHQRTRDEPNAYRFALRARETGKGHEAFGTELSASIVRWITEESTYRFVSPANQPFDPALEGCTVTGTPNLMYEAILR